MKPVNDKLKEIFNNVGYEDFKYDFSKIDKYFNDIRWTNNNWKDILIEKILKDVRILPFKQYQRNLKYEYTLQLNDFINCTIYYYDSFINDLYYNFIGKDYYIDVIIRAAQREYNNKLKSISFELNAKKISKSEHLNELRKLFEEIYYSTYIIYKNAQQTHTIYNKLFNSDELFIMLKGFNTLNIVPFDKRYKVKAIDTKEFKSKYKDIIIIKFIDYLVSMTNNNTFIISSELINNGIKIIRYNYC